MRQRTPFARVVTPTDTYVKYGLVLDGDEDALVATIEDIRRETVRTLTQVTITTVDTAGRRRLEGFNEQQQREVWTFDTQNCGCGGLQVLATVPEEVPA